MIIELLLQLRARNLHTEFDDCMASIHIYGDWLVGDQVSEVLGGESGKAYDSLGIVG